MKRFKRAVAVGTGRNIMYTLHSSRLEPDAMSARTPAAATRASTVPTQGANSRAV